jgi:chromosome segregation ATPase
MRDVQTAVKALNIQLDNLCQFLPQDKVSSFAQMKPVELLAATERAAGGGELAARHERLIALRADLGKEAGAAEQVGGELARLRAENARSERSVAAAQRRDELLAEAEGLRAKVPWAEYRAAKEAFDGAKAGLAGDKAALQRAKAARGGADAPLRAKRGAAAAAQDAARAARAAITRADPAAADAQGRDRGQIAEDWAEAAAASVEEAEGLEAAAAEREAGLLQRRAAVDRLRAQLAALPSGPDPGVKRQREAARLRLQDLGPQELALEERVEVARADGAAAESTARRLGAAMRRLGDAKQQRLQRLNERHRGIADAWAWLQANRGRYQGAVYGAGAACVCWLSCLVFFVSLFAARAAPLLSPACPPPPPPPPPPQAPSPSRWSPWTAPTPPCWSTTWPTTCGPTSWWSTSGTRRT